MAFERNLFTTEIEIFWIHTGLSFDECWEHCLGRFSNWGTKTFDIEKDRHMIEISYKKETSL